MFPDWLDWFLSRDGIRLNQIDGIVTSDSYFATNSLRLGPQLDRWFPSLKFVALMEHHDVHQRQAFWQSGFEQAAILTLDTCGENLARLDGRSLAGTIARKRPNQPFETLSEMCFPESSAGLLYGVVNHHIGFRQGDEGKTMGLAPYGRPELYRNLRKHLTLGDDGGFRFLGHKELQLELKRYVPPRLPAKDSPLLDRHMDVAFAGQALLEEIVCNAFTCAMRISGERKLTYAGGVALNSVANEIGMKAARPDEIYISPNASDTGQSLGCALAGAYELCGWQHPGTEISDLLGPNYTEAELLQAVKSSKTHVTAPVNGEMMVARCLANGHIVAYYFGRAEFGPRALGNRSILCDPRRFNMKDYVNAKVKHREGFRPFAPSILEEYAEDWFDLKGRSPYMLRVVPVREHMRAQIPAVVHIDGSARVQTVSRSENPEYWRLISAFHQLTQVPILLDTSFNVQGKPIVEQPSDAVNCFLATEIDILYLRPYILSKFPLGDYLTVQHDDFHTTNG
ncbi:MAG: carbamoyltransferase C-terminal domain-containing protein [Terracidiphilus sp.]